MADMTNKVTSHKKVVFISLSVVFIMFLFCFAMVPLYNLLCKATGFNTLINPEWRRASNVVATTPIDFSRTVTVQFVTINHDGLPWDFYPEVKSITMHPGETRQVYFDVKNRTNHAMTVQAIPNMTPVFASAHFHKIACFCFTQQTLAGQTSKRMLLSFNVDNTLPKNLKVMTLAYTLFDQGRRAR